MTWHAVAAFFIGIVAGILVWCVVLPASFCGWGEVRGKLQPWACEEKGKSGEPGDWSAEMLAHCMNTGVAQLSPRACATEESRARVAQYACAMLAKRHAYADVSPDNPDIVKEFAKYASEGIDAFCSSSQ